MCGYAYHGPQGYLAFAPRLTPEAFRAAFTCAEGWGTFSQERHDRTQHGRIDIVWGRLRLKTLGLALAEANPAATVTVRVGGTSVRAQHVCEDGGVTITLADELVLEEGNALEVDIA